MPKRSIVPEDELAERLEILTPEHQARVALIDNAMQAAGIVPIDEAVPTISNIYDEQLLKLIDSVTLE